MKTNTAEQRNRTDRPFASARMHAQRVEDKLSSDEMKNKSHSDLEAFCDGAGREWARNMLEEHLALRSDLEQRVDVTGADGVDRTVVRESERHLETIVGRVSLPRKAYQARGCTDLHPMDAALNLPREIFSHGVRRMVVKEAPRASFDEVVTILVDVVHVIEYIWIVARALFGNSHPEAEPWVSNRLLELLGGRTGGEVARNIRRWASRKQLDDRAQSAIKSACGYLAKRTRTRLMQYGAALEDGLPIATGVIEGACRHLVKDRMDRTGARWSLTGAEAVLRLRAIRSSGEFDEY